MRLLFIIWCGCLILSTPGNAQSLHLFQVDTANTWFGGPDYYNAVTLSGDRIIHSFEAESRYQSSLLPYGDVNIKTYDANGYVLEQEKSSGDSLFIRKTILSASGEKIILGDAFHQLALYDVDTSLALDTGNYAKSFILHLDNTNHAVSFNAYFPVKDMAIDERIGKLYFIEQYDYEAARLYVYDLNTGAKDILATISGPRLNSRIIKTKDYIYFSGSSITFYVDVNGHHETTGFPYADFVVQLDNSGQFKWIKMIKNVTTPHIGLAEAPGQGVYMCADLSGATVIGADTLLGPSWGGDFFLTRIDSNGRFLWATETPNNTLCGFALGNGYCLGSDDSGNAYIAGASRALIRWDDSTVIGRDSNIDVPTVLIYNRDGHIYGHIIASAGETGRLSSIDVAGNGDFAVTGRIDTFLTYDGITRSVPSGYHPYFLYYKNSTTTSIKEAASEGQGFDLYPNPVTANGVLTIERSQPGKAALEIWNLLGQKIWSGYIYDKVCKVQLPYLNGGLYFIQVDQGAVKKLIVQ